jgi:alkaline phosphatase D
MRFKLPRLFVALALACGLASAQPAHPLNAPAQFDKPYVVLVSIDGFRYDYAARDNAVNLLALARQGVRAEAMLPVFPSTTFPNHYSIATGLYTAHHGIVENDFYDPVRDDEFHFHQAQSAGRGAWWGGTPIWLLAEQQGLRAACFFWPGSDADIAGTHPAFYYPYDGSITNEARLQQVLAWLKLPPAERPHLITTYFSDVDHDGHIYGPDSPEVRRSIRAIDALIGELMAGLRASGLPVNLIVVSDHGMVAVSDLIEFSPDEFEGARFVVSGAEVKIYSQDEALLDRLAAHFRAKDARLRVVRPAQLPARLHYSGNARIGDLLLLSSPPVLLRLAARPGAASRAVRMRQPWPGKAAARSCCSAASAAALSGMGGSSTRR